MRSTDAGPVFCRARLPCTARVSGAHDESAAEMLLEHNADPNPNDMLVSLGAGLRVQSCGR
eukprot:1626450-Rhodomonas_salina.1